MTMPPIRNFSARIGARGESAHWRNAYVGEPGPAKTYVHERTRLKPRSTATGSAPTTRPSPATAKSVTMDSRKNWTALWASSGAFS